MTGHTLCLAELQAMQHNLSTCFANQYRTQEITNVD
jgi:hypothetical protein